MRTSRSVGLLAIAAAVLLLAGEASAKSLIVSNSGINCSPQTPGITTLYPTIQSAIDALPVAAQATNVVIVCPGIYPEQLKITKPITITGVLRDGTDPPAILGNTGEVRIVPPAGGLQ